MCFVSSCKCKSGGGNLPLFTAASLNQQNQKTLWDGLNYETALNTGRQKLIKISHKKSCEQSQIIKCKMTKFLLAQTFAFSTEFFENICLIYLTFN